MNPLRRAYVVAKGLAFQARRRRKKFDIQSEPWLEPDARAYLGQALESSRSYLEFGSGGSTLLALSHSCRVVSVESDRFFMAAVEEAIHGRALAPASTYRLISTDIGPTAWYGMPIMPLARFNRHKWHRYPQAPWTVYESQVFGWPDIVLIDGRFRVACALECMMRIPAGHDFQVLVDDWTGRPEYALLPSLCEHVTTHGRMGVFRRPLDFDSVAMATALNVAYLDPR